MCTVLPTLYSIDKSQKERYWIVKAKNSQRITEYGVVGGKSITKTREFQGKNIGKSNETTAEQQTIEQIHRDWVKQIAKGYYAKCEKGKKMAEKIGTGDHNASASTLINENPISKPKKSNKVVNNNVEKLLPMKASKLEIVNSKIIPRQLKNLSETVYFQPKFDGWRCVARLVGNEVILTSRTGKQYPWFKSIKSELLPFLSKNPTVILDGELYSHEISSDPSDRFRLISSICGLSRSVPHERENEIALHVFDVINDKNQATRLEMLDKIPKSKWIRIADTYTGEISELEKYHRLFCDANYEGTIVRSGDCIYTSKRSLFMFKHKDFSDGEWEIVDAVVKEGVGLETFVWVCKHNSTTFNATPVGTKEEKIEQYRSKKDFIGKMANIKYQDLSRDGIPRFGVVRYIRED